MSNSPEDIKKKILELTREYTNIVHSQHRPGKDNLRKSWNTGYHPPPAEAATEFLKKTEKSLQLLELVFQRYRSFFSSE